MFHSPTLGHAFPFCKTTLSHRTHIHSLGSIVSKNNPPVSSPPYTHFHSFSVWSGNNVCVALWCFFSFRFHPSLALPLPIFFLYYNSSQSPLVFGSKVGAHTPLLKGKKTTTTPLSLWDLSMTVSEDEKEKQKGYVFFSSFRFHLPFYVCLVFVFISLSSSGSLTTLYSLPWGFPYSSPPPSYSCWRLVELSKVDVFSLSSISRLISYLTLNSHNIFLLKTRISSQIASGHQGLGTECRCVTDIYWVWSNLDRC